MKNLSKLTAKALIASDNIETRLAEAIELNPYLASFLAHDVDSDEIILKHLNNTYFDRINFKITKVYFNACFENTVEYEYDELRYVQNEDDSYYKSSYNKDEVHNIEKLFHFTDKDTFK